MTLRAAPSDDSAHRQRFQALWEDHYADVLAFALRRVGDRALADDIVAETYLAAWRRREHLPEDVRPWLFGAARKVIGNSRRGEHRRAALLAKLSHETSADRGSMNGSAATRSDVTAAFNRLSDSDREILALIVWEELTPSQAARVLRMPAPRFSVRLHRAKQRLRQQLAASPDEASAQPLSPPPPHPVSEIRS